MENLITAVLWRSLNSVGAEYFDLWKVKSGWLLRGRGTRVHRGVPLGFDYDITCDGDWETRQVDVHVGMPSRERSLYLKVDSKRRWLVDGRGEQVDLRGCHDVDLLWTPATNMLPIKRLSLKVGQSNEVVAAWIRFPELEVRRLKQKYSRLGQTRYRYESGTGFAAELEVDSHGLVVDYPGGWKREATIEPP
jgi:hypothetical protein